MVKRTKFTTLTPLHKPQYGAWSGSPRGQRPNPALCCEEVCEPGRAMIPRQCAKSRGYGPEKAYCAVHDPAAVQSRREASQAAYEAQWKPELIRFARAQAAPSLIAALQVIAAGHNDPRTFAAETLAAMNPLAMP